MKTYYPILILLALFFWACSKKITNDFHSDQYNKKYAELSVFPGAEGYGTNTIAGRGGVIYKVENLKDSGPGSLRFGLEMNEPRMIIFEVGGTIYLNSPLIIRSPYISIFGQTAPAPGITLTQCGMSIQTHDVLIQHLSVRPGDSLNGCSPDTRDGIEILNFQNLFKNVYNVVIDHCSVSWAIDENMSIWNYCSDITISNCIISHGLHNSLHSKGGHSKGILIGDNNHRISLHNNIFAFNDERNPRVAGNTSVEFVNNLIYGCNRGIQLIDANNAGAVQFWAEENVFLPEKNINHMRIKRIAPHSKLFLNNNVEKKMETDILKRTNSYTSKESLDRSNISVKSKKNLIKQLFKECGANPTRRNHVDHQLIQSIRDGSGKIIDCTQAYLEVASGKVMNQDNDRVTLSADNKQHWGLSGQLRNNSKEPLFLSLSAQPRKDELIPIESHSGVVLFIEREFENRHLSRKKVYIFRACENYSLGQLPSLKSTHNISIYADFINDKDGNGYSGLEDWIYSSTRTDNFE